MHTVALRFDGFNFVLGFILMDAICFSEYKSYDIVNTTGIEARGYNGR